MYEAIFDNSFANELNNQIGEVINCINEVNPIINNELANLERSNHLDGLNNNQNNIIRINNFKN